MMNKKKMIPKSLPETPQNSRKNLYFIRPQKAKLFSYHSQQSSNVSTSNTRCGYNKSTDNINEALNYKLNRHGSAPFIHLSQMQDRATSLEKSDNYQKNQLIKIQINSTQQTIQVLRGKLAYEKNQLTHLETQLKQHGILTPLETRQSSPKRKLSSQDTLENLILKQKVRDLIAKLQQLDQDYENEKQGIDDILLYKTTLMESTANNYMLELKRSHCKVNMDRKIPDGFRKTLQNRYVDLEEQIQYLRGENYHEKLQIDITEELHQQLITQKEEFDQKLQKLKELQDVSREKYAKLSYNEEKIINTFSQLFYNSRDRKTNRPVPSTLDKQIEELTKTMASNSKQIEQLKLLDQQHQYSVIKGIQDIKKEVKIQNASREMLQIQIDRYQDRIFITHKVTDYAMQSDLSNNMDSSYQMSNA